MPRYVYNAQVILSVKIIVTLSNTKCCIFVDNFDGEEERT